MHQLGALVLVQHLPSKERSTLALLLPVGSDPALGEEGVGSPPGARMVSLEIEGRLHIKPPYRRPFHNILSPDPGAREESQTSAGSF